MAFCTTSYCSWRSLRQKILQFIVQTAKHCPFLFSQSSPAASEQSPSQCKTSLSVCSVCLIRWLICCCPNMQLKRNIHTPAGSVGDVQHVAVQDTEIGSYCKVPQCCVFFSGTCAPSNTCSPSLPKACQPSLLLCLCRPTNQLLTGSFIFSCHLVTNVRKCSHSCSVSKQLLLTLFHCLWTCCQTFSKLNYVTYITLYPSHVTDTLTMT